jgi:hypothetical protein
VTVTRRIKKGIDELMELLQNSGQIQPTVS